MEDIFSSEDTKRAFIEGLQPDEFIELLDGVNGILCDKKKDKWGMHEKTMVLEGVLQGIDYVSPRPEDKPGLFDKVLASVKEMNRSGRDLKDIALLVSSSFNAIHAYSDANGRTSRLLYFLITNNLNDETKDELRGLLAEEGRDELDINPGLVETEIDDLIGKEIGIEDEKVNTDRIGNFSGKNRDLQFRDEISEEDKKLFGELLRNDSHHLFLAVFQYLQHQESREKYLSKYVEHTAIALSILSKDLTQEGLSQIIQNYKELKKKYVEILTDSIAHPENKKYQIEDRGQQISLKDYFELRIKEETERIAERVKREKERQHAEEDERVRITQKEGAIKERFNQGEGEYKTFFAEETNSFRQLTQELAQIAEEEKSFERQQFSEEQKIEILKEALFELAQKINSNIVVSRGQVDAYVVSRQQELLECFSQYNIVAKLMKHLDDASVFKYRFSTSKDYEVPFFKQEYLEGQGNISMFLDDLFSQSIYYVTENGSSLRLKLFEVKSKKADAVVQPVMERIFYSDKIVDHRDRNVVKVDNEEPSPHKYVFEIASPGFLTAKQIEMQQSVHSGVGIIRDEEGIYVNIPEGSALHSGWRIVSIKSLK